MRPPYRAPTRDFYFSAGVPALPRFSCLVCCAGVEPPPPSFLHPISLPPSFDSDELLFTNHDTHPPAFRLSVLSFVRVFCVLFLLYGVYRPGGRRFCGGGIHIHGMVLLICLFIFRSARRTSVYTGTRRPWSPTASTTTPRAPTSTR